MAATDTVRICIVYEDGGRSRNLINHIRDVIKDLQWESLVEIQECDLDAYDNCIIALSSSGSQYTHSPGVILSRFSGSAFYRGNDSLQDLSLLLCKAHTEQTSVINGLKIVQLENSKPLQMATLTSSGFLDKLSPECRNRIRLPCTVLMKQLSVQSMKRAFVAIKEGKCMPHSSEDFADVSSGVVIKPAFGGGSNGVVIVNVDQQSRNLPNDKILSNLVKKKATGSGSSSRPWLMQRLVGTIDTQLRAEVIGGRVAYVVVIQKNGVKKEEEKRLYWKDADNLCMCEVGDDVRLTLCPSTRQLSEALKDDDVKNSEALADSVFEYAETVSSEVGAEVLAMEFRLSREGHAYMIDFNLNSNYNFDAEEKLQSENPRFVSSAERYVEMFVRSAKTHPASFEKFMRDSDIPGSVPVRAEAFDEAAKVYIDGTPATPDDMVKRLDNGKNWSPSSRSWDSDDASHVMTFKGSRSDLTIKRSGVTDLITQAHLSTGSMSMFKGILL